MKVHSLSRSPGMQLLFVATLTLGTFGIDLDAASAMPRAQDNLLTAPSALIVSVDARGRVTLNETAYGTVTDT
ncbi:MAG: hypothetical protein ABIP75_12405, partial [Pyrinomonadaceae bacterium]